MASDFGKAAHLSTPMVYSGLDRVANHARPCQPFFRRPLKTGWIGKAPMQPLGDTGENRTALRARLIANGDDMAEHSAGLELIEHGLGFIAGNINSDLPHCFHHNGVEFAGLESGAVRLKFPAADLVEERPRHLTAGAVMNADKQYSLFHGLVS